MLIITELDETRRCLYCGAPMEFRTNPPPEDPRITIDYQTMMSCSNSDCCTVQVHHNTEHAKYAYDRQVQNAKKRRRKS